MRNSGFSLVSVLRDILDEQGGPGEGGDRRASHRFVFCAGFVAETVVGGWSVHTLLGGYGWVYVSKVAQATSSDIPASVATFPLWGVRIEHFEMQELGHRRVLVEAIFLRDV